MRPLIFSINVFLDGCCDHAAANPGPDMHRHSTELLKRVDALIFGRITYQMMESAFRWTGSKPDWMEDWMVPFAKTMDAAKKYVVSDTLQKVDWNTELVRGKDLEKTVRDLKNRPGLGLLTGGVKLPLSLAKLGLIDEYEFVVHPKVVGHGPYLFEGLPRSLELKELTRKKFEGGAEAIRYRGV